MTKILLETVDLKKSFEHRNGVVDLFKNVNIKIKTGDLIALVGPSGSGKSSFLHLLALLDEPTKGKILFLEDIDEYLYSFERMLYHMRDANMFEEINGLIIGELCDFKDQEIPFGRTSDEIIMDICGNLDIPIISNFACGHGKYQVTLPISIPARLNTESDEPELTILESATRESQ